MAPICKHWMQKGFCIFRDSCIYRHPPLSLGHRSPEQEGLAASGAQAAHGEGPTAAANGATTSGPMAAPVVGLAASARRRGKVKKKFRAGAFRRWLLDTFGREALG